MSTMLSSCLNIEMAICTALWNCFKNLGDGNPLDNWMFIEQDSHILCVNITPSISIQKYLFYKFYIENRIFICLLTKPNLKHDTFLSSHNRFDVTFTNNTQLVIVYIKNLY